MWFGELGVRGHSFLLSRAFYPQLYLVEQLAASHVQRPVDCSINDPHSHSFTETFCDVAVPLENNEIISSCMSHMNKGQYCARVWLLLAAVWKFRGFCSQESITYKIQRSEDKWPSCLQMQHVGFFSSTLCVCKAQLANSGCNSCIVWKKCSRPHSGTLEMSLNTAFALTHAN